LIRPSRGADDDARRVRRFAASATGCRTPAVVAAAVDPETTSRLPAAPADWELLGTEGLGPFITRAAYRRPDGARVEWTSRRHRKGQGVRVVAAPAGVGAPPQAQVPRRTWWIAGLFSVGSICFALGAWPAYVDRVSGRVDGLTFFVGSVFFTCAAYLCVVEAANSPGAIGDQPDGRRRHRLAAGRPHSIDWWATLIQLVGTLYFNVMTFRAVHDHGSASEEDRLVWRPDVIGSICFIVASYLAWAEVCHGIGRLRLRDLSWWIVVLNLLGSVCFGVSAIGAFTEPDTGDVTNLRWDNGGTILGAVCFLVAAVMLVPEACAASTPAATT
jgi:hypothetical protein